MASLQKKRDTYWAVFPVGKRRKWIKIGNVTKSQANKILKELEAEFANDRLDLLSVKKINFYELAEKYMNYVLTNKSKSSLKREAFTVNKFKDFYGDIPVLKFDAQLVEDFKRFRVKEGVVNKTVNRELEILRHMLSIAKEWMYIVKLPKFRMLPLKSTPVRFLSIEEIKRLLNCCTPWLKPMVVVMLNSGIRFSELKRLTFEDIDPDTGILTVKSSKNTSNRIDTFTDYRLIPINNVLKAKFGWLMKFYVNPTTLLVYERQPHQMKYVFCKPDGSPIGSIRTSYVRACNKACIVDTDTYILRHSFASHMIMNGVDIVTLQKLLGHTSLKTTMVYAHISNSHKADSVKKLPWDK